MSRWWRDRAFWAGFASIWDLSGQRVVRDSGQPKMKRQDQGIAGDWARVGADFARAVPEAPVAPDLREEDVRVDIFTSGVGIPGIVRVIHLPTGLTESARGLSTLQNKALAFRRLREKLGLDHPVHQPGECPRCDALNRLYERAEDCAALDIPLDEALQTVRDGYSSIEADREMALDP